jgi:hypothetical protein
LWLMRLSMHKTRRVRAFTHYVDDSGSDNTKFSLVGGPVFAQEGFFSFHYEWDRIASLHRVQLPIHMKEFARPYGRLAYVTDEQRRTLFFDLVRLINQRKLYSLTTVVDNAEFQACFPGQKFRGYMGATPLAFLWCMILNNIIVSKHSRARKAVARMDRMAYLVARSDHNSEITDCWSFWKSGEERTPTRVHGISQVR